MRQGRSGLTKGDAAPLAITLGPAVNLVRADGQPLGLQPGRKLMALLCVLALLRGERASRRLLASILWSRLEEPAAMAALRLALHRLGGLLRGQGVAMLQADRSAVWIAEGRLTLIGDTRESFDTLTQEFGSIDPALASWLRARRPSDRQAAMPARPEAPAPQGNGEAREGAPWIRVDRPVAIGTPPPGLDMALQEELGGALARMRWVKVALAGEQAGRGGGVGFALRSSYEAGADAVVLRLSLIDERREGLLVWTGRFAAPAAQGAAALCAAAAAQLDSVLLNAEAEAIAQARGDASGFALALSTVPALARLDQDEFLAAGARLRDAVDAAPDLGLAHSLRAYWCILAIGQHWSRRPERDLIDADAAADRAVTLDGQDARALAISGHVSAFLRRDITRAQALHERALRANPNLPLALRFAGASAGYAGELATARSRLVRSLELAPMDPHAFIGETSLAYVAFLEGDPEEALRIATRVRVAHPRFSSARKIELAALGVLGRRAQALPLVAELQALERQFNLRRFRDRSPYVNEEHGMAILRGLQRTGLT